MNIENTMEGSMQSELVPLKQRHGTELKLPGLEAHHYSILRESLLS